MSDTYPLEIEPVDISGLRKGNVGIDYVHRYESGRGGPHVMVNALMHGNELCGAHAIAWLLHSLTGPVRGTLTLSFANVAAYESFDPADPTASRFVDEDMNRLWTAEVLDGERHSAELTRARAMRPAVAEADFLLDIHSMQLDCAPLMLSGLPEKGRILARSVAIPPTIVADRGHDAGRRMRDYEHFGDPADARAALLVECGQHWRQSSVDVAKQCLVRFLDQFDMLPGGFVEEHRGPTPPRPRIIEVVGPYTIRTDEFRFVEPFNGLEVIEKAGTVIGYDGAEPVATPHDACVLIMPSRRLRPGQTAVRLGRYLT
jgi:predicted deacylase